MSPTDFILFYSFCDSAQRVLSSGLSDQTMSFPRAPDIMYTWFSNCSRDCFFLPITPSIQCSMNFFMHTVWTLVRKDFIWKNCSRGEGLHCNKDKRTIITGRLFPPGDVQSSERVGLNEVYEAGKRQAWRRGMNGRVRSDSRRKMLSWGTGHSSEGGLVRRGCNLAQRGWSSAWERTESWLKLV